MSHSIPRRLPAPAQDRMLYSGRHVQHAHANFVLKFAGRVDEQRLCRAIRVAMDAEPVFGCRYVPGRKPYWERRGDLDSLLLCTLAETADFLKELQRFVDTPCDGTRDPLLSARIVRGETDALLFKTNHLAADVAGYQQLLSLVADLYREPQRSAHGISPNLGSRGTGQLFRQIGWRECLRILRQPRQKRAGDVWRFPVANAEDRGDLRAAIRHLEPAAFDALRAFGKRFGATLNNIFVAACFRALWRFLDFPAGIPQSIAIPADARRYLRYGETEAICNFNAPLHATLERVLDEPFEETLIRVRNCPLAEPVRREWTLATMFWISMLYHLFLGQIERGFKTALKRPANERPSLIALTNLGAFDPQRFDFGIPLTDMYRISQAAFAPALVIAVSSFRKKLTFAINYPSSAIRAQDIQSFLDIFIEELSYAIQRASTAAAAAT